MVVRREEGTGTLGYNDSLTEIKGNFRFTLSLDSTLQNRILIRIKARQKRNEIQ